MLPMNTTELSLVLRKEFGYDKAECYRITDKILKTIWMEEKKGNPVRLDNFNIFQAKKACGRLRAKFTDPKNFFK
jgi:nucleoid DNA-binding protein